MIPYFIDIFSGILIQQYTYIQYTGISWLQGRHVCVYNNICPEVGRKPWNIMSPEAKGRGQQSTQRFFLSWRDKYSGIVAREDM